MHNQVYSTATFQDFYFNGGDEGSLNKAHLKTLHEKSSLSTLVDHENYHNSHCLVFTYESKRLNDLCHRNEI